MEVLHHHAGFLTKERNSVSHQSCQLTEDTEGGGEKRGGRGRGGKVGQERWRRREGEVKAKREVKEIKEVSTE